MDARVLAGDPMNQEFTLMAVDVDGSLANPVMQISVLLCGIALAAPLIVAFRYATLLWQRIGAILATVVGGAIISPFINRGNGDAHLPDD
jgi:hypothetical protein